MKKVEYYVLDTECWFEDDLIFSASSRLVDELRDKLFIKYARHHNHLKHLSDEDLLKGMVVKELPKPTTFPKYNNEQPFKIKYGDKIIKNPTITSIRWGGIGHTWEYQIENIGHKGDFQPECLLSLI
jgi:hypothetical protein